MTLPGISGSLFPGRFLADGLGAEFERGFDERAIERQRARSHRWWQNVEATCGPVTGLTALVDVAAFPLVRLLDFRVGRSSFARSIARVVLETVRGTPVAMLVLPWSVRPVARWRDACAAARDMGADWCLVFAPPHLSVVDARGHAARRSVDVTLPAALAPDSFRRFRLVAHATAFDVEPASRPRTSETTRRLTRLDRLVAEARAFQDRVRRDLHRGVMDALSVLAPALEAGRRPRLEAASSDQALTVVYRILFLLFAESRGLVPSGHPLYRRAYTVGTLCRDAGVDAGRGLWDGLSAITRLSRSGCRTDDLIVSPFNGRLFARASAPALETRRPMARRAADERDRVMKTALLALGTRRGPGGREEISYRDLGVEQLGAVYERVLDVAPGHRKESGTFYTPQALADFVVRRTLAPLVAGASPEGILDLRVVDPSMGSGAFLVSACGFLADAYERAMVDAGRLAESDLDADLRADIRRRIAERCLAGVDVNPTAVQLARLSLWLTSLARGKPLGFLDHQLRVGNSLIGASPDDLWRTPRRGPTRDLPLLPEDSGLDLALGRVVRPIGDLLGRRDETVADVHAKEALWSRLAGPSSPLAPWRTAAAIWCARWFTAGRPFSEREMRAAIDATLGLESMIPSAAVARIRDTARSASERHRFFHWPLEFARDFYDTDGRPRARPGFDAVIGNPPWEMLRRDPRQSSGPGGSGASGAAGAIDAGPDRSALVRFIRESGRFLSCDRGHVNLYQPFVERALDLTRPGGRVGLVLPWGLAVDDGAAALRERLLARATVDTIVGLDNGAGLFPIHRGLRFLVLVASPGGATSEIRTRMGVRTAEELEDLPARDDDLDGTAYPVRLTREALGRVGGPTRRIPDVRGRARLDLLERLAAAGSALAAPDGWAASFGRELNATEDRRHFRRRGVPVIDGKHLVPFGVDTRSSRNFLGRDVARRLLPDRGFERPRLGYRDVSGVGNRQALIAAIVPGGVATTHTIFCLRGNVPLDRQYFLCGVFNSLVLNAAVRMLMGGHVTTSLVEGLAVPVWRGTDRQRRIAAMARRLHRSAGRGERHLAARARLEADVARLFGLGAPELALAIDMSPASEPEVRHAVLEAFGRLAEDRAPAL